MTLDELNRLDDGAARARLTDCCAATAWVEAMLAGRPFASREATRDVARDAWADIDETGLLEAFAAHPRIGDLDSLRAKYASTRELADGEQTAVNHADETTLNELARLNRDYEARHGFIFIVFATAKSARQMLDLLAARINNSRDDELRNAAAEQLKITLLRLDRLLD